MKSPEAVCKFLNLLNNELKSRTRYDLEELQKIKNLESQTSKVKSFLVLHIILNSHNKYQNACFDSFSQ